MYILGQYRDGNSFVHLLDPRVKVLCVLTLSLLILGSAFLPMSALTLFLLVVCRLCRLPFRCLYEAIRPMAFFLALLFCLQSLETGGTPALPISLWGVTVTCEGLLRGALMTWRFALLLAWAALLTITTSPSEMVGGMERLLRPFRPLKVDSHAVALMISVAMRFVPVMGEEFQRVRSACLARGADFRSGSISSRAKKISSLLSPLVLGIFRRADRLAVAIEARGYGGGPRTCMRELRLSSRDLCAVIVTALITALCLFI